MLFDMLFEIGSGFVASLHSPQAGLAGVAIAAFVAATLLPLSSEVALLAFAAWRPEQAVVAGVVATLANTAGGLTTYALARFGRQLMSEKWNNHVLSATARWQPTLQRYGPVLTALAWLPVVGDMLVLAAGYLRLPLLACSAWQLLGRGLRYAAVLGAFSAFMR